MSNDNIGNIDGTFIANAMTMMMMIIIIILVWWLVSVVTWDRSLSCSSSIPLPVCHSSWSPCHSLSMVMMVMVMVMMVTFTFIIDLIINILLLVSKVT